MSKPTTKNPGWGFYGTIAAEPGTNAQTAWDIALDAIARTTQQPEADVALFLDSTYGRHFADEVQDRLRKGDTPTGAIWWVATAWQDRRIGSASSHHTGIPKGTPQLTGFVCSAAIHADSQ